MKKCVIIMNPESGKVKNNYFDKVCDILREYNYDTEIKYTKKRYDATYIMENLEDDISLVISAGGDGTLSEVVTGNLRRKSRIPLANLPLGTTNDVANMYGLHGDTLQKLEQLLKGKMKNIDVIKMNDKPFVYVACVGDYTEMAYKTPRELKKKLGRCAYILYALKHLTNKIHNYHIKYKIDNKVYEGVYSFIFVTNSSRVAGVNHIYDNVKLNDHKFEVAFAKINSKKDMLKLFLQINTMEIKDIKEITYFQTDNLEIEFQNNSKISWCIDGEELKAVNNNFKFEVDVSTTMLMPKENINKLFESE